MQTDHTLHCSHEEILHPLLSKICPEKVLIRLTVQADLSWVYMSERTFSDVVAQMML